MEELDIIEDNYGICYYKKGTQIRHRDGGPAIENSDGYKSWWINGNVHRENGPAIEYSSGNKIWYLNGKIHREGGPAIEYTHGNKEWWINGVQLSPEKEKIMNLWWENKNGRI